MKRLLPSLASATAVVLAAGAAQAASGPIQASGVWSRPAMAGLPTGVAYLTLTNRGPTPDRLLSASSPKAARVSVHRSLMTKGVMTMAAVDGMDLAPNHPVVLAPNGYHLMLEGLKGGLTLGESYPLTLRFAHAKPMTIQVQVRRTAGPTAGGAMAGMSM